MRPRPARNGTGFAKNNEESIGSSAGFKLSGDSAGCVFACKGSGTW
jgi:hypothetical protein